MDGNEHRGARTPPRQREELRGSWRDYQAPLRWDWSAAAVILGLLVVGALLALAFLQKL